MPLYFCPYMPLQPSWVILLSRLGISTTYILISVSSICSVLFKFYVQNKELSLGCEHWAAIGNSLCESYYLATNRKYWADRLWFYIIFVAVECKTTNKTKINEIERNVCFVFHSISMSLLTTRYSITWCLKQGIDRTK